MPAADSASRLDGVPSHTRHSDRKQARLIMTSSGSGVSGGTTFTDGPEERSRSEKELPLGDGDAAQTVRRAVPQQGVAGQDLERRPCLEDRRDSLLFGRHVDLAV